MKKSILFLGIFAFLSMSIDAEATSVKGYIKPKSGKYVMPHQRTKANKTKLDNYSTKGNTNPFTGKKGSANPLTK